MIVSAFERCVRCGTPMVVMGRTTHWIDGEPRTMDELVCPRCDKGPQDSPGVEELREAA